MNAGIRSPLFKCSKPTEIAAQRKTRQAFGWKGLRPSTSTAQRGSKQREKDTGGSDKCVAQVALDSGSFHLSGHQEKGFAKRLQGE